MFLFERVWVEGEGGGRNHCAVESFPVTHLGIPGKNLGEESRRRISEKNLGEESRRRISEKNPDAYEAAGWWDCFWLDVVVGRFEFGFRFLFRWNLDDLCLKRVESSLFVWIEHILTGGGPRWETFFYLFELLFFDSERMKDQSNKSVKHFLPAGSFQKSVKCANLWKRASLSPKPHRNETCSETALELPVERADVRLILETPRNLPQMRDETFATSVGITRGIGQRFRNSAGRNWSGNCFEWKPDWDGITSMSSVETTSI